MKYLINGACRVSLPRATKTDRMNVMVSLPAKFCKLGIAVLFATLLFCFPARSQVFVYGTLTQNTTFTKANNPYIVTEELIVPKGITLTVEPGTEMRFSTDTRLLVHGTLIARGTPNDSIYFTNVQNPNPAIWRGIVLDSTNTMVDSAGNYLSGTVLSYVSIFNTRFSVTISGNSSILIEHSLVRISDYGIFLNGVQQTIVR